MGNSERRKRRKWLWVAAGVVFAGAALLVGVFIYLTHGPNARDEFKFTLAKLKSEGFAVSPDDLRWDCPDADNAWFAWKKHFGSYLPDETAPAPAPSPGGPRMVRPEKLLRTLDVRPGDLSQSDKARLRDYFSATSATLAVFETIASKSRFFDPANRNQPMNKWVMPGLRGEVYGFEDSVYYRGLMAVEDGNRRAALHLCMVALRFSRIPPLSGDFLNLMEGVISRSFGLTLTDKTLHKFPLSEAQERELFDVLDFRPFKESVLSGLDLQRLRILEFSRDVLAGEADPGLPPSIGLHTPTVALLFLVRSYGNDAALIQEKWVEMLKAAREPHWKGKPKIAAIRREVGGLSMLHPAPKAVLPYQRIFDRLGDLEGITGVLRVAIACKMYASRTGKFPASLDELSPEFFDTTPLDPFTGRPFSYRLFPDGGFAVWSAGRNGIDDTSPTIPRGAGTASKSRHRLQASGDDILFVQPPPPGKK